MLQLHRILEKAECLNSFIRLRLPNGSAKNQVFSPSYLQQLTELQRLMSQLGAGKIIVPKRGWQKLSMIYSPAKIYVIIVFKVELVFCNKVLLQVQNFELESLIYSFFY